MSVIKQKLILNDQFNGQLIEIGGGMNDETTYLMGSPKYWLAMPTVAPVMQITMDTL